MRLLVYDCVLQAIDFNIHLTFIDSIDTKVMFPVSVSEPASTHCTNSSWETKKNCQWAVHLCSQYKYDIIGEDAFASLSFYGRQIVLS